jgi:flagellar assembly factor FliW
MSAHLSFVDPPSGFEPLTDFTLVDVDGGSGLFSLTADGDPGIRLYVLDAAAYIPDYAPELSDAQASALELTDPADAMLLVVAYPANGEVTVNLLAPIVVNGRTGAAAQLVLDGDWPLRCALAIDRTSSPRPPD